MKGDSDPGALKGEIPGFGAGHFSPFVMQDLPPWLLQGLEPYKVYYPRSCWMIWHLRMLDDLAFADDFKVVWFAKSDLGR